MLVPNTEMPVPNRQTLAPNGVSCPGVREAPPSSSKKRGCVARLMVAWLMCTAWLANAGMYAQEPHREPGTQPRPAPDLGRNLKLTPLNPKSTIWIDVQQQVVVVQGVIVFREGPLEMFACTRQTKEHESIVAVDCQAQELHAALLAIGLKPGAPVRFRPEYVPVEGPAVQIDVSWRENDQWNSAPAQSWVRNVRTNKALDVDWIFGGSSFWIDPETNEEFYLAEKGDLICVSNFPTAMLDIPVRSPRENADLWFEAWTERIPPLQTQVYLLLQPREKPDTQ